jgi:hypothetical protein
MMMKVVIESPFAGRNERNYKYLLRAMKDSFERNESPFASHIMYPPVLDDTIPEQRNQGIQAGFQWGMEAEAVVVYADYGISQGMAMGIEYYTRYGKRVIVRHIGENDE